MAYKMVRAWTQASLRVGIGVRIFRDLSVPASISSSHSADMLVVAVLQNTGISAAARITLREAAQ